MLVTVVDEHRFRAMGTDVHVQVVDGPGPVVADIEAQLRADEDRWSRFQPTSELRRLPSGVPCRVTGETAELLGLAFGWRRRSQGWFDPLLGRQLRAAGYDRTFELVAGSRPVAGDPGRPPTEPPVLADDVVVVPDGAELDLGGIAKGHSADRAVAAVLAAGGRGACVNVGGDLRCAGASPTGDGWWCALDHGSGAEASELAVGVVEGAVATSTTRRRRWRTADGHEQHHLLDPRDGRPARTRWHTATVVAPTAATAEVLATVVLLAPVPLARALLADHDAAAIATDDDGAAHHLGPIDALLAPLALLPDD